MVKYDFADWIVMGESSLAGRRIQISGSASARTDVVLIRFAHEIVRAITRSVIQLGGGLVLAPGKEPKVSNNDETVSLTFDWTAFGEVASCLRDGACKWKSLGLPVVAIVSEKTESDIPNDRLPLWRELLQSGILDIKSIFPGARSGALLRQLQAEYGDILLAVGGGTGVEHLAELYLNRRRPVIPLDLPLGGSRGDGRGGAATLYREARTFPKDFFRLRKGVPDAGAQLAGISTNHGTRLNPDLPSRVVDLLLSLASPKIFYVRLLNRQHADFANVERFFRRTIDPAIVELGFERIEFGTDPLEYGFINVGIFDALHFAEMVIVDVTDHRPNCLIEFGYALGRGLRVIVTATEGTILPFDQQAIPCFFWGANEDLGTQRERFLEFFQKNINRPPIVLQRGSRV